MIYVMLGFIGLVPFSLIAVFSMIASLRSLQPRRRAILLLLMTLLWTSYLVTIGGDIFPAWRHFVPLIVIFTFAIIDGMPGIWRRITDKATVVNTAVLLGLGVLCGIYMIIQSSLPKNQRALSERWEWDGQAVGLVLKSAFYDRHPLLAVTAAGCLPYWSELPSLDMLGLNDYYLPRHPPKDMGQGFLAHELGDGRYVLDQKPDIIVFHTGSRSGVYRSAREMEGTEEFHENYVPIRVMATAPHEYLATIWIRKYSEKIGIRRTPFEIRVPGFMLNIDTGTPAHLNPRGALVAPVAAGQRVGIEIDAPVPGEWKCDIKSSSEGGVTCQVERRAPGLGIMVLVESAEPVDVEEIVLLRTARPVDRQGAEIHLRPTGHFETIGVPPQARRIIVPGVPPNPDAARIPSPARSRAGTGCRLLRAPCALFEHEFIVPYTPARRPEFAHDESALPEEIEYLLGFRHLERVSTDPVDDVSPR